jgi:uncharacterized protein YndB with AHSA1/START domain
MNASKPATERANDEITIERVFDAPRALVFEHWVEAEHVGAWFAPATFDVTACEVDARPGGSWRVTYRAPGAGDMHIEHGEFKEVASPERLVFTLINENGRGEVMLRSEVSVTFTERDGKTTMFFRQTGFASSKMRGGVADGWGSCFQKLDAQLAAEREVRDLFEGWWRASETKDLDASMAPIARDVLSYEHETPLSYRGVDALRSTCKAGFERMPEGFRWDMPDLKVVVRGDIAVTWGLNHMHANVPGKPTVDMWSRGTRVFQRIDGRWQMIHQHVSFPFDPATGAAKMDLTP